MYFVNKQNFINFLSSSSNFPCFSSLTISLQTHIIEFEECLYRNFTDFTFIILPKIFNGADFCGKLLYLWMEASLNCSIHLQLADLRNTHYSSREIHFIAASSATRHEFFQLNYASFSLNRVQNSSCPEPELDRKLFKSAACTDLSRGGPFCSDSPVKTLFIF